MWTKKSAKTHIVQNWAKPASEVAFKGPSKLHAYYGGVLSNDEITKVLSTFESYSIMRQEHGSKNRKWEGFSFPTWLWNVAEVDSFSVQELSEDNQDVQHIMAVVNTFSKKAYVACMFDRSARSGLDALKHIFSSAGEHCLFDTPPCKNESLMKKWKSHDDGWI